MIRALLAAGADPMREFKGWSPLELARSEGRGAVVAALEEKLPVEAGSFEAPVAQCDHEQMGKHEDDQPFLDLTHIGLEATSAPTVASEDSDDHEGPPTPLPPTPPPTPAKLQGVSTSDEATDKVAGMRAMLEEQARERASAIIQSQMRGAFARPEAAKRRASCQAMRANEKESVPAPEEEAVQQEAGQEAVQVAVAAAAAEAMEGAVDREMRDMEALAAVREAASDQAARAVAREAVLTEALMAEVERVEAGTYPPASLADPAEKPVECLSTAATVTTTPRTVSSATPAPATAEGAVAMFRFVLCHLTALCDARLAKANQE